MINRNSTSLKYLKLTTLLILILNISLQAQDRPDPYANTQSNIESKSINTISIDPDNINVLSSNLGTSRDNLELINKNFMYLWAEAEESGTCYIEWTLQSPSDGEYDSDIMVEGKGSKIELNCNGYRHEIVVEDESWQKLNLGDIKLKSGENNLAISIETTGKFKIASVELTKSSVKEQMLKQALKQRNEPNWFKDAGYGVMFQWTNRATPISGDIKEWEDKVNDFNIDAFVNMVDEVGAAYVLWSITWGEQYISAPIKSLDRIISGRTTKRDLLGEMADKLHKKGIKLIFYYHYGYECYHSQDMEWLKAAGGLKADKSELYSNLIDIISEIGQRYRGSLDGWWFDGGERFYNCHFDGSPGDKGILSAPFKEITEAAKRGNSKRVVAYNSWVKPRLTEFQDYYGGEGYHEYDELKDGIFTSGRQIGLMAHSCFILEKRWGHIDMNSPIVKPKYSAEQLINRVHISQKNRYPISINLEMYEDGSVSKESVELLKRVKEAIR